MNPPGQDAAAALLAEVPFFQLLNIRSGACWRPTWTSCASAREMASAPAIPGDSCMYRSGAVRGLLQDARRGIGRNLPGRIYRERPADKDRARLPSSRSRTSTLRVTGRFEHLLRAIPGGMALLRRWGAHGGRRVLRHTASDVNQAIQDRRTRSRNRRLDSGGEREIPSLLLHCGLFFRCCRECGLAPGSTGLDPTRRYSPWRCTGGHSFRSSPAQPDRHSRRSRAQRHRVRRQLKRSWRCSPA